MKCLKCFAENDSSLRHCEKCGAPLPVIKWNNYFRKRIFFTVTVILLVCAGGFAYFFRDIVPPAFRIRETISSVDKETRVKRERAKQEGLEVKSKTAEKKRSAAQDTEKSFKDPKVIAGWVIITDPWGRQVNKFRSGLSGDGWLALPVRACYGGNKWHFQPDTGREAEISGGLWIPGDNVGLWHLAEDTGRFAGPELTAWNDRKPVSWSSLESDDRHDSIKLRPGRAEGFFVSSPLPDYIKETGIFVQSSRIVGWSFGQWPSKAYMWPGKTGTDLEYKTWIKYFYNITFANGREERFAMILAMQKERTATERLEAFIKGFRLQPKLPAKDTPHYLLPEEIIKQMRALITSAIRRGEGNSVVDILDSRALKNIEDITLLIDIVPVIARVHGFEAAIEEIEDSGRYITRGIEVPALNAMHLKLYQEWLQSLVSAGTAYEGWQAHNAAKTYYPDDPQIHLLGVELALLYADWVEAGRLLYMRDYPPEFQDRYKLLDSRIAEMRGQEGKIVINFTPGSNRIIISSAVNDTVRQNFLVDTGATTVTIPSSTAEALGLIVRGRHTLSTASGVVTVSEVTIDAIEINGWVEYGVRALVLDMPGQPGLGLLGLNYLGRFSMDLKTEEGILMLTPR